MSSNHVNRKGQHADLVGADQRAFGCEFSALLLRLGQIPVRHKLYSIRVPLWVSCIQLIRYVSYTPRPRSTSDGDAKEIAESLADVSNKIAGAFVPALCLVPLLGTSRRICRVKSVAASTTEE